MTRNPCPKTSSDKEVRPGGSSCIILLLACVIGTIPRGDILTPTQHRWSFEPFANIGVGVPASFLPGYRYERGVCRVEKTEQESKRAREVKELGRCTGKRITHGVSFDGGLFRGTHKSPYV